MAKATVLIMVMVLGLVVAVEVESKKADTLAVEGVVLCQHCNHSGSNSLSQAWPISGAQVRLKCKGPRSWVGSSSYTNYDGYFLILIDGFNFELVGVEGCRLSLLSPSSQERSCATFTDINGGMKGAPILFTRYNQGQALYTAGPFAFAPSHNLCNSIS